MGFAIGAADFDTNGEIFDGGVVVDGWDNAVDFANGAEDFNANGEMFAGGVVVDGDVVVDDTTCDV